MAGKRVRTLGAAFAAIAVAAGTAACGQDEPRSDGPAVVASTDVWGSVAEAVAGEHATVESILTGPAADPHAFEASPAAVAKLMDATLVVYNGGGYDGWVDTTLAERPDVATVDAYALLPDGDHPANEHVFYHLGVAKAVADQIADRLAEADAEHADDFRANAAEFARQADEIAAAGRAIGSAHPDAAVLATEPVAHYLLVNAAVPDRTPPGFAAAAEEGDDPAPADLAAVLDLLEDREVSALLVNPQTASPLTRQIERAAHEADVPVVTVTETLPAGIDYLTWQRQTTDELAAGLQTWTPVHR